MCRAVTMRTRDPDFQISSGRIPTSEAVFVRIADSEGHFGVGVGPVGTPLVSGETGRTACMILETLVLPGLIGEDPFERRTLIGQVEQVLPGNLRARCAVDLALWDLLARATEVPVSVLLGGTAPVAVRILRLLPMGTEEKTVQAAASLIDEGFDAFKIKLGRSVGEDIRLVEAFREAYPDVTITVDFNGRYSPREAVAILDAIASHRVRYAEQPIPRCDPGILRWVRDRSEVAILADESAVSIEDIVEIGKAQAADAVSVKIGKFGGLTRTLDAIAVCEALGLEWIVGTTPAGQYIDAANAHLVSARGSTDVAEVGEFQRLEDDPVHGLRVDGGKLVVPPGSGFGVSSPAEEPGWFAN
jgi:L-alanine-DL-glutamate epimerase-like enolase superfamily enzyme